MTVMGANNKAGILWSDNKAGILWSGGQFGAPPNFYMNPTPPQRSVLYNGGGFTMPTGELRCVAPPPILPSIADVMRNAAAGQDSLLGSAIAAGIFVPQTLARHSPMSPGITPLAGGSRETSFPEPDMAIASASTQALIAQLAARSTTARNIHDGQNRLSATALPSTVNCGTSCDIPVAPCSSLSLPSEPSERASSSSGVATPPALLPDSMSPRRPLQALAFEEFLREEHTSGVVVVAERMPGSVQDDGGQRPIALAGWVVLDVDRWWDDVRRWTGEPSAVNGVCHPLQPRAPCTPTPCTLHPTLAPPPSQGGTPRS